MADTRRLRSRSATRATSAASGTLTRINAYGMKAAKIRRSTAQVASALLAPAPVASLVLLFAASRSTTTAMQFGMVASVAIGSAVLLPRLSIEYGVLRGWLSEPTLPRREERPLQLAIATACVVASIALVQLAGASAAVVVSLYAMAIVLGIALGVTFVWKISLHVAALAGAVIITSHLLGMGCVLLIPLVVVVAWSRLELGEHTLAQVGAGAVIGVVGSTQAYLLAAM